MKSKKLGPHQSIKFAGIGITESGDIELVKSSGTLMYIDEIEKLCHALNQNLYHRVGGYHEPVICKALPEGNGWIITGFNHPQNNCRLATEIVLSALLDQMVVPVTQSNGSMQPYITKGGAKAVKAELELDKPAEQVKSDAHAFDATKVTIGSLLNRPDGPSDEKSSRHATSIRLGRMPQGGEESIVLGGHE